MILRAKKKAGLGDTSKMGLVIMKIGEPSYFNFLKKKDNLSYLVL